LARNLGGSKMPDIDAEIKRAFVRKQFEEAKGNCMVTCGCGLKLPLRFAYKCLYCGEFYCQTCAEEHFGKTREEYFKDKESNNVGIC
jgi:hypothetical protein